MKTQNARKIVAVFTAVSLAFLQAVPAGSAALFDPGKRINDPTAETDAPGVPPDSTTPPATNTTQDFLLNDGGISVGPKTSGLPMPLEPGDASFMPGEGTYLSTDTKKFMTDPLSGKELSVSINDHGISMVKWGDEEYQGVFDSSTNSIILRTPNNSSWMLQFASKADGELYLQSFQTKTGDLWNSSEETYIYNEQGQLTRKDWYREDHYGGCALPDGPCFVTLHDYYGDYGSRSGGTIDYIQINGRTLISHESTWSQNKGGPLYGYDLPPLHSEQAAADLESISIVKMSYPYPSSQYSQSDTYYAYDSQGNLLSKNWNFQNAYSSSRGEELCVHINGQDLVSVRRVWQSSVPTYYPADLPRPMEVPAETLTDAKVPLQVIAMPVFRFFGFSHSETYYSYNSNGNVIDEVTMTEWSGYDGKRITSASYSRFDETNQIWVNASAEGLDIGQIRSADDWQKIDEVATVKTVYVGGSVNNRWSYTHQVVYARNADGSMTARAVYDNANHVFIVQGEPDVLSGGTDDIKLVNGQQVHGLWTWYGQSGHQGENGDWINDGYRLIFGGIAAVDFPAQDSVRLDGIDYKITIDENGMLSLRRLQEPSLPPGVELVRDPATGKYIGIKVGDTVKKFVEIVEEQYRDFLGRHSETPGSDHWTGQLSDMVNGGMSYEDAFKIVQDGFRDSVEFSWLMEQLGADRETVIAAIAVFIEASRQTPRVDDPDATQANLELMRQVIARMKAGATPEDAVPFLRNLLIGKLFRSVIGREASAEELKYFQDEMKAGWTMSEVEKVLKAGKAAMNDLAGRLNLTGEQKGDIRIEAYTRIAPSDCRESDSECIGLSDLPQEVHLKLYGNAFVYDYGQIWVNHAAAIVVIKDLVAKGFSLPEISIQSAEYAPDGTPMMIVSASVEPDRQWIYEVDINHWTITHIKEKLPLSVQAYVEALKGAMPGYGVTARYVEGTTPPQYLISVSSAICEGTLCAPQWNWPGKFNGMHFVIAENGNIVSFQSVGFAGVPEVNGQLLFEAMGLCPRGQMCTQQVISDIEKLAKMTRMTVIEVNAENVIQVKLDEQYYKVYWDPNGQAQIEEVDSPEVRQVKDILQNDLVKSFNFPGDKLVELIREGLIRIEVDRQNLRATVFIDPRVPLSAKEIQIFNPLGLTEVPGKGLSILYQMEEGLQMGAPCSVSADGTANCPTPAPHLLSATFQAGDFSYQLNYVEDGLRAVGVGDNLLRSVIISRNDDQAKCFRAPCTVGHFYQEIKLEYQERTVQGIVSLEGMAAPTRRILAGAHIRYGDPVNGVATRDLTLDPYGQMTTVIDKDTEGKTLVSSQLLYTPAMMIPECVFDHSCPAGNFSGTIRRYGAEGNLVSEITLQADGSAKLVINGHEEPIHFENLEGLLSEALKLEAEHRERAELEAYVASYSQAAGDYLDGVKEAMALLTQVPMNATREVLDKALADLVMTPEAKEKIVKFFTVFMIYRQGALDLVNGNQQTEPPQLPDWFEQFIRDENLPGMAVMMMQQIPVTAEMSLEDLKALVNEIRGQAGDDPAVYFTNLLNTDVKPQLTRVKEAMGTISGKIDGVLADAALAREHAELEAARQALLEAVEGEVGSIHQRLSEFRKQLAAAQAALDTDIAALQGGVNSRIQNLEALVQSLRNLVGEEGLSDATRSAIQVFLNAPLEELNIQKFIDQMGWRLDPLNVEVAAAERHLDLLANYRSAVESAVDAEALAALKASGIPGAPEPEVIAHPDVVIPDPRTDVDQKIQRVQALVDEANREIESFRALAKERTELAAYVDSVVAASHDFEEALRPEWEAIRGIAMPDGLSRETLTAMMESAGYSADQKRDLLESFRYFEWIHAMSFVVPGTGPFPLKPVLTGSFPELSLYFKFDAVDSSTMSLQALRDLAKELKVGNANTGIPAIGENPADYFNAQKLSAQAQTQAIRNKLTEIHQALTDLAQVAAEHLLPVDVQVRVVDPATGQPVLKTLRFDYGLAGGNVYENDRIVGLFQKKNFSETMVGMAGFLEFHLDGNAEPSLVLIGADGQPRPSDWSISDLFSMMKNFNGWETFKGEDLKLFAAAMSWYAHNFLLVEETGNFTEWDRTVWTAIIRGRANSVVAKIIFENWDRSNVLEILPSLGSLFDFFRLNQLPDLDRDKQMQIFFNYLDIGGEILDMLYPLDPHSPARIAMFETLVKLFRERSDMVARLDADMSGDDGINGWLRFRAAFALLAFTPEEINAAALALKLTSAQKNALTTYGVLVQKVGGVPSDDEVLKATGPLSNFPAAMIRHFGTIVVGSVGNSYGQLGHYHSFVFLQSLAPDNVYHEIWHSAFGISRAEYLPEKYQSIIKELYELGSIYDRPTLYANTNADENQAEFGAWLMMDMRAQWETWITKAMEGSPIGLRTMLLHMELLAFNSGGDQIPVHRDGIVGTAPVVMDINQNITMFELDGIRYHFTYTPDNVLLLSMTIENISTGVQENIRFMPEADSLFREMMGRIPEPSERKAIHALIQQGVDAAEIRRALETARDAVASLTFLFTHSGEPAKIILNNIERIPDGTGYSIKMKLWNIALDYLFGSRNGQITAEAKAVAIALNEVLLRADSRFEFEIANIQLVSDGKYRIQVGYIRKYHDWVPVTFDSSQGFDAFKAFVENAIPGTSITVTGTTPLTGDFVAVPEGVCVQPWESWSIFNFQWTGGLPIPTWTYVNYDMDSVSGQVTLAQEIPPAVQGFVDQLQRQVGGGFSVLSSAQTDGTYFVWVVIATDPDPAPTSGLRDISFTLTPAGEIDVMMGAAYYGPAGMIAADGALLYDAALALRNPLPMPGAPAPTSQEILMLVAQMTVTLQDEFGGIYFDLSGYHYRTYRDKTGKVQFETLQPPVAPAGVNIVFAPGVLDDLNGTAAGRIVSNVYADIVDLKTKLALTNPTVTVKTAEAITWSSGCLGWSGSGGCTMALVPGAKVILEVNGTTYEYHHGSDLGVGRLNPDQEGKILFDASRGFAALKTAIATAAPRTAIRITGSGVIQGDQLMLTNGVSLTVDATATLQVDAIMTIAMVDAKPTLSIQFFTPDYYELQSNDNLVGGTWTPRAVFNGGPLNPGTYTDTTATGPMRFYRLVPTTAIIDHVQHEGFLADRNPETGLVNVSTIQFDPPLEQPEIFYSQEERSITLQEWNAARGGGNRLDPTLGADVKNLILDILTTMRKGAPEYWNLFKTNIGAIYPWMGLGQLASASLASNKVGIILGPAFFKTTNGSVDLNTVNWPRRTLLKILMHEGYHNPNIAGSLDAMLSIQSAELEAGGTYTGDAGEINTEWRTMKTLSYIGGNIGWESVYGDTEFHFTDSNHAYQEVCVSGQTACAKYSYSFHALNFEEAKQRPLGGNPYWEYFDSRPGSPAYFVYNATFFGSGRTILKVEF